MKLITLLGAMCMVVSLVGCGGGKPYEGEKRIPLSGKVTLDGQPIDGGTITFMPSDEKKRASGGAIVKGEYKVPEEKGAHAGSYKVQINWFKPTGKQIPDSDTGGMVDEVAEVIPVKYNTHLTTLTAEVSASKTTFDFELTSK